MRELVFGKDTPVRSGAYAASMDLAVNGISRYKLRVARRNLCSFPRRASKMMAERQDRLAAAVWRLSATQGLAGMKSINISNMIPYASLIEFGTKRMKPRGVFAKARMRAEAGLAKIQGELG